MAGIVVLYAIDFNRNRAIPYTNRRLYTAKRLHPSRRAISGSGAVPKSECSLFVQNLRSGWPTGCPRFRQYSAIFFFHVSERGRFAAFRTASVTCGGIIRPLSFAEALASAFGFLELRRPRSSRSSVLAKVTLRQSWCEPSFLRGTPSAFRQD
jgi:hypothetical protein